MPMILPIPASSVPQILIVEIALIQIVLELLFALLVPMDISSRVQPLLVDQHVIRLNLHKKRIINVFLVIVPVFLVQDLIILLAHLVQEPFF